MKKEFLDKDACLEEARRILSKGKITGMSELQIAHEIYFHALVFFFCEKTGLFRKIQTFADPVDMHDGGDNLLRRFIYASSWIMTKGK